VFLDTDTPILVVEADTVHRDAAQWVQEALDYTQAEQAVAVGTGITPRPPRTGPDVRHYRIRLLP
jgi:hypothetical protein